MAQQGNIAEYTSPVDTINPDKQGEAASQLSRAAGIEGGYYKQAGEEYKQAGKTLGDAIDNHQFMSEVSTGAAASAALTNNMMTNWRQKASQPGAAHDPDLQKKFMDDTLEPALQQWQDAFSTERGQKWALEHTDTIRQEFYHTTAADMANITGEQRHLDVTTQMNQLGAMVARSPATADLAMKQWNSYIDAQAQDTTFQTPENASKLQAWRQDGNNELAKVQVKAFADQGNFKVATGLLDSGAHDANIPPNEQIELRNYIKTQERARRSDANDAWIQQKRQQEFHDNNALNQIADQIKPDKDGLVNIPPNAKANILAMPSTGPNGLSWEGKEKAIAIIDHVAKGTAVDDPKTAHDNIVNLSSLTPKNIQDQAAQGLITPEKMPFWNSLVANTPDAKSAKDAFTNAQSQYQKIITATFPMVPVSAEQRQKEVGFTNWLTTTYQAAMEDPKLKDMPLGLRSKQVLSSQGILTPENLSQFLPTPLEVQKSSMSDIGPGSSHGATEPPAATQTDVTKHNDGSFLNKATKQWSYMVNGKLVDADGKEIK